MVSAIPQHESGMGTHAYPMVKDLPPHFIPLGCPRAPVLGAQLHALNLNW